MKALLFAATLTVAVASSNARERALRMARRCPNKRGSCSKEYRPVVCGQKRCEYDNKCIARANGFNFKDCQYNGCPNVAGTTRVDTRTHAGFGWMDLISFGTAFM
jgi:hypothetical protein